MMARRMRLSILLLLISLSALFFSATIMVKANDDDDDDHTTPTNRLKQMEQALSWGDEALAQGEYLLAIRQYTSGLRLSRSSNHGEDQRVEFLDLLLSLHTNRGTAFSAMGQEVDAIDSYEDALDLVLDDNEEDNEDDEEERDKKKEKMALADSTRSIVSQTAYFLGLSLQSRKQHTAALEAYERATQWDELLWSAFANRASILYDYLQRHAEALEAYQVAFDLLTKGGGGGSGGGGVPPTDPPDTTDMPTILAELQYRIGLCIVHGEGMMMEAASALPDTEEENKKGKAYKCVLAASSSSSSSSFETGNNKEDTAPQETDCAQVAAHSFSRALQYNPHHEAAKHMLATVTADATMTKASNTFITSLFDDYAANFEHSLVAELGYNGYERLRRVFDRAMASLFDTPPSLFSLVVDGGCGTGLVGEQFRNVSQTLVGVDLSAAILAEAQRLRPHLYDETRVGDITEVLDTFKGRVDLFVAADSLIYLGDLQDLFASLQRNVQWLATFTLENVSVENEASLEESRPDWRWQLTPSGRFAHRRAYVEEMATANGFHVLRYEEMENFRREKGQGVRGHAFVLQKRLESDQEEL